MNSAAECQADVIQHAPPQARSHSPYIAYVLLAIVLILTFAVRYHLRNIPLERDEGEYAYAGQLMLQGIPPYKLAYNMKLPGTYAAYAVIMALFGQTAQGIRMGLIVVNLATILLVFLLARRVAGSIAGVAAGAAYALLSAGSKVLGFCGHATHFVVLFSTAGVLLLLKAIERENTKLFFSSGLLLGVGFVMKQPGLIFVFFGVLYLVGTYMQNRSGRRLRPALIAFSLGAALPFGITCLLLWWAGVFSKFWFWTVSYAAQYAGNYGLIAGAYFFTQTFLPIVGASAGLWIIAALGIAAIFWDPRFRKIAPFIVGFLVFSFLAVCPALTFRPHYFILLLPAISLLIGIAISAATEKLKSLTARRTLLYAPCLICALAIAASFYRQRDFFLETDPIAACHSIYYGNPFPEAVVISDYIRQHTTENAQIAVLGSEPEIYFYSHRHSATGYIYTYGLMEEQKFAPTMQRQMIGEIEAARPEMLVFVNLSVSWLPDLHSEQLIYVWARKYIQDHYDLAGVVDIPATGNDYYWGDDAKNHQPRPYSAVLVFKRKSS